VVVTDWWRNPGFLEQPEPTEIRNFAERFVPFVVVYASVLRALPPAALSASPAAPARGMIRRVFNTAAFFFVFTFTYAMDPQSTGFSVPEFAAPSPGHHEPTTLRKERVPRAYHV
jgi:hypothetical protein